MITTRQVRNALTGSLAVMALGLFASCSEGLLAPLEADFGLAVLQDTASLVVDQTCELVDGVLVCTPAGGNATTDDGDPEQQCEFIGGVLYCEPPGGG
jgi:hypothetical protein